MQNSFFKNVPFFRNLDPFLLGSLLEHLQLYKSGIGEILYRRHDNPSDSKNIYMNVLVYFILEGKVDYYVEHLRFSYKTMLAGSCFGDYEVIFQTPRHTTMRTRTTCVLLTMNKDVLIIY